MTTQMEVVDYRSLSRRELQSLCKKHGIPANKTNAYMADALSSLSKVSHHSGFGSVTSRTSEDEGSESVPCQINNQNEMGDTLASTDAEKNYQLSSKIGSKRIEPMEEDTVPAVKDTYLEELACNDAQRVMELGDDATETSKGQSFMLHIESHVDDQNDPGQAYTGADKIVSEGSQNSISRSSPCKETNKINDSQSNTTFEKRSIHNRVDSLDQMGDLPMDVSPARSEYASTMNKEVGKKHQEDVITGNDTGYKTVSVVLDTIADSSFMLHVESHVDIQDGLGQAYEDVDKKFTNGSENSISRSSPYNQSNTAFEKRSIHTGVDSLVQVGDIPMDASHAGSECAFTMKKEVGNKLQEEAITGNGRGYKTVSLVLDTTADSSICLNHQMLENYSSDGMEKKNQNHIGSGDRMVSLEEETLVDDAVKSDRVCSGDATFKKCPVKKPTAETSGSSLQFFVECDNGIKLSVDLAKESPFNWTKTQNDEFSLTGDLNDNMQYKGDAVMENTTNGSAKLADLQPQSPDIERSENLNRIACSTSFSPVVSTKKPEGSRVLRRTSSVLIPPHGANRGSSPFISHKSSRFSSPVISPHKASRFLFPSSAVARGKYWTSVSEETGQSSCLSERIQPMTAEPSKVVEDFSAESGVPEKNGLLSENKPLNDGCQDVEMVEQSSHSSLKMSKNEVGEEQDIQHKGEVFLFHNQEKETKSISQVHYSLEKAQKENLMKDFQSEEPRIISRYKDNYKKFRFTKNLRGMKSLARASTLRADILAKRRAMPSAEKDSVHSQPLSMNHNILHSSQNVQEIQTEHARETLVISPRVYRERDLCESALNLGKDPSKNVAPSTLLAPGTRDDLTVIGRENSRKSSTGISESYQKLSFKAFARRRFLERALAESRERIQAQKMQHTGKNNCFSTEKQVADKLPSNNVPGCGNQKRKSACILEELNSTNSNICETENEFAERVTERQKRHREQFKTPLTGKSKKKAIEIAKRMALVQRNEILKSKRGITSPI